jgi:copper resistance protein C
MTRRTTLRLRAGLAAILFLFAGAALAHLEVVGSEPADGATLDRPVRSLRVFFNQEPDLALSKLELEGPEGAAVEVQGLHTMGQKDLMATVSGRMPDGEYTVKWQTAGDDGHVQKGEIKFTMKRGGD